MNHSTTISIAAHSNGIPMVGKTKEFMPPVPERLTDTVTEGRIIESFRDKGFKLNAFSFKQEGMTSNQALALGVATGDTYVLTFKESVKESDGSMIVYTHEITGVVTKGAKDSSKISEENIWSVDGHAASYKLTIDGKVIHDMNLDTQKVIMFGIDFTSEFLDAVR